MKIFELKIYFPDKLGYSESGFDYITLFFREHPTKEKTLNHLRKSLEDEGRSYEEAIKSLQSLEFPKLTGSMRHGLAFTGEGSIILCLREVLD